MQAEREDYTRPYCTYCNNKWYNKEASVIGQLGLFVTMAFLFGCLCGYATSDPDGERQAGRRQLWVEAVAAGHALEIETTSGPGYVWKER